jgi:hypothetical protein
LPELCVHNDSFKHSTDNPGAKQPRRATITATHDPSIETIKIPGFLRFYALTYR